MTLNASIKAMVTGQAAQGGAAAGASYLQLYIRALGADSQQIGYLNSLTRIANTMFALPIGWISDRFSLKKITLIGFF